MKQTQVAMGIFSLSPKKRFCQFTKKAFKKLYENARVGAIGFGTERYSRGTEHRRGLVAEPTPLVSAAGARHVVAAWQEETRAALNLPPPQISAQPGL